MTQFISFGSGSSGNSYFLLSDGYGLLIDAGIGIRKFKKHYKDYGFRFPDLKAILITHEHADHIKASGMLANEFHLPVYATSLVHQGMARNIRMTKKVDPDNVRLFEHGSQIELGPFRVTSFHVPHDSSDNSGYFIEWAQSNLCIITDAGYVTDEMAHYIARSQNLVIEANYDADMLAQGPYPAYLKRRILNETGHLCNTDLAAALSAHLRPDIRHIWLCHLSENNNTPQQAQQTVVNALRQAGFSESICDSVEPLKRLLPSAQCKL